MAQPFIGEIRATSFNLAPRGWLFCNGQVLAIAQNQALFAILGTTYGGNGVTTFALPNLQGRTPVATGDGVTLGRSAGQAQVTLTAAQIPAHSHMLLASSAAGAEDPSDRGPAAAKVYGPAVSLTGMSPSAVGPSGGSQPHDNMQPYLTISYMIAVTGIFPSQS